MDTPPTPKNESPFKQEESIKFEKDFSKIKISKPKKTSILPSHRAIFKNYEEQGFRLLGKAIRRTGVYSEEVAKHTEKIKDTKSWKALMAEYMPEEFLAQRHSELLDKRVYRVIRDPDDPKKTIEVDDGPETAAVTRALELAYKLRGSFSKNDGEKPSTVMYNLFYKPEVREHMKTFEDGLKKSLYNEINKRNIQDADDEAERTTSHVPSGTDGGTEEVTS